MPQRNAQNPIKIGKTFGAGAVHPETGTKGPKKGGAGNGHCPACGAPVSAKPGFRFSSLTCPKCGASMGKK
ncbi:MAG: hypothetical protein JNK54_09385 [Elusimicrobia bacterium]|nr:hypothetical protein [Elusimicrobiota bacterium]